MQKRIPVGIDDFREMVTGGYYFIDKTDFIAETFDEKCAAYIRQHGSGKSLNLSMLRCFYSIKEQDSADYFDHLNISRIPETKQFQNQYPVLLISMKKLLEPDFGLFLCHFSSMIQNLVLSFPELLESKKLDEYYKDPLRQLAQGSQDYIELTGVLSSTLSQPRDIILFQPEFPCQ